MYNFIIIIFNCIILLYNYLTTVQKESPPSSISGGNLPQQINFSGSQNLLLKSLICSTAGDDLIIVLLGKINAKKRELIGIKKLVIGIILIVLTSTLIFGVTYQKSQQEPSKITITIGDKELQYVTAKNKWNGRIYDREDTFKVMIKEGSGFEIPYFKIGTFEVGIPVVIDFKKYPPDKFTIYDILLNENGNKMYSSMKPISIPFELKNGKYSFQINKNMGTIADSNWEPGKTYNRGFRLMASWGENECEYAFIVKTDK